MLWSAYRWVCMETCRPPIMERNDVKIIKKRIFIPENSFFILDVLQADKSAALRCITYVPFLWDLCSKYVDINSSCCLSDIIYS